MNVSNNGPFVRDFITEDRTKEKGMALAISEERHEADGFSQMAESSTQDLNTTNELSALNAVFNDPFSTCFPIEIYKFNDLDPSDQTIALLAIENINKKTSTDPLTHTKTWHEKGYTASIKRRSKDHLFLAKKVNQFIGYTAFYTNKDRIPITRNLTDNQAYCSWTAVDENFWGQGVAVLLKMKIFDANVTAFSGHIKRTNHSSLKVLNKFKTNSYEVNERIDENHVYYEIKILIDSSTQVSVQSSRKLGN